jgi:hypothetical protein
MRKLSSSYSVTYEVRNADNKIIKNKRNNACYSSLYSDGLDITDKLILTDFYTEETGKYSRIYIKRLAKICNLKLDYVNEDEIELIGFNSDFKVKLFTSLFRILFEHYPGYGGVNSWKQRNINFLESYVNKKNNSNYKDMLERLIYYYQKNEVFQGAGHGITTHEKQVILIKNIQNVKDWDVYAYSDMQKFFSVEN